MLSMTGFFYDISSIDPVLATMPRPLLRFRRCGSYGAVRGWPAPTFGPTIVKLVSFNVLNFFNGDGAGGFPTSRGALTPADFNRQRSKILTALAQINADAVGLIEIENDGTGANSALQDLVNDLNQTLRAGTYAFINGGGLNRDDLDFLVTNEKVRSGLSQLIKGCF